MNEEVEAIVEEESPEVQKNVILSDPNPTRGEALSVVFFFEKEG